MSAAPILAPTPVRFARILFATDFSACSEHALAYAAAIARAYSSHVYLVHVLDSDAQQRESDYGPRLIDTDRWEAERQLRRLASSNALDRVEHSTLSKAGRLWEVLDAIVRSHDVDLIVVGTHGRGGLGKLFMGSSAEEILRHARCPVMTIGPHAPVAPLEFTVRRILFATAYHTGSLHALTYAHSLSDQQRAELILFHALRIDDFSSVSADSMLAQAKEKLTRLVHERLQSRITHLVQACASPAAAIVHVAQDQSADLIILGAHVPRSTALATHLPWSTAHEVICKARCPVLTVSG